MRKGGCDPLFNPIAPLLLCDSWESQSRPKAVLSVFNRKVQTEYAQPTYSRPYGTTSTVG